MLEYFKEYGTYNVPKKGLYSCSLKGVGRGKNGIYHYKGKLGEWLTAQRQAKNGNEEGSVKLSSEQSALLQILVDEG